MYEIVTTRTVFVNEARGLRSLSMFPDKHVVKQVKQVVIKFAVRYFL